MPHVELALFKHAFNRIWQLEKSHQITNRCPATTYLIGHLAVGHTKIIYQTFKGAGLFEGLDWLSGQLGRVSPKVSVL